MFFGGFATYRFVTYTQISVMFLLIVCMYKIISYPYLPRDITCHMLRHTLCIDVPFIVVSIHFTEHYRVHVCVHGNQYP